MNLTIGKKLALGFGLCVLIIVILVAYNLTQLGKLRVLQDEGAGRADDAVRLQEVASLGLEMYTIIADAIINRDLRETRRSWEEVVVELVEDMKAAYDMSDTDVERRLTTDAEKASKEIVRLFEKELMPLLEMSTGVTEEIRELDAMIDHQVDVMEEKLGEASKSLHAEMVEADAQFDSVAASISTVSTILAILGVIGAIIVGLLITRAITGPINLITGAASALALGDIQQDITFRSGDEVGKLADAFREMIDALKGKANVAEQIAKGNLGIEVKVASNDDVLGKAMGTMRESLKNMQTDLQSTIEAQKNGDLDKRCNYAKFDGAYGELLKGVNDSLEAVITPMLESIAIMGEYAKGEMSKEMRQLPGKQIVLTEGLNAIRNNIKALIDEGIMLAMAAEAGELKTRGNANKFEGGYMEIIQGMNKTIENILKPVNEAVSCLEEMAGGNLAVSVAGDYKGDHAVMKEAMNSTLNSMNELLGQVKISIDQVSNGAQQVSDSSQSLSQGATEQAASLEEVSSSMVEQASQTKRNAENAEQANHLTLSASDAAETGNQRMNEMLNAMQEINESSGNISKIIKVIDEIAFQTNLLALNAAVEAARAGVHGKGFAVVAEEVRNLAQRSAQAAKETTELIEGSIKKAENGTNIANETAKALGDIVSGITKASDLVSEIASASKEQTDGIEQINQSLGQIDQVTQSNTANAEESASASEELSGQAVQLKEMISKFRLRGGHKKAVAGGVSRKQLSAGKQKEKHSEQEYEEEVGPEDMISLDDDDFGRY